MTQLTTQAKPESATIEQQHPITPLSLIQDALHKGLAPEVLKELVALQQSMIRFEWEAQERQARIDFDNALSDCQKAIGRIAPNVSRKDTNSWWADYPQLDRTIRPIYTGHDFSIAFSEVPPIAPTKVRIQAELSRSGISKLYHTEITPSTTGPKGGAMATATDADAIASSRAMRYLLLKIFNIAVGIDADEKKGGMTNDAGADWVASIEAAADPVETMEAWTKATAAARKLEDYKAMTIFTEARDKRLKELRKGQK